MSLTPNDSLRTTWKAIIAGAALAFTASASAGLINPGFEADDASGGDLAGATGWIGDNLNFTSTQTQNSGNQSGKLFGPFGNQGATGFVGASLFFQDLAAAGGQTWLASAFAQHIANDAIAGVNFGIIKLEFLGGGVLLSASESAKITNSTATDLWVELSVSATAPLATDTVRIVLVHESYDNSAGSVYFDDASLALSAIPEPASLLSLLTFVSIGGLMMRRRAKR